jgi:TATA-binding protein-associated factor Taf7
VRAPSFSLSTNYDIDKRSESLSNPLAEVETVVEQKRRSASLALAPVKWRSRVGNQASLSRQETGEDDVF